MSRTCRPDESGSLLSGEIQSNQAAPKKPTKVSLIDLYAHLPPEEAQESVHRILGFFRAYCGQGQSDGTFEICPS